MYICYKKIEKMQDKLGLAEYKETLLDLVSEVVFEDYNYIFAENKLDNIIYKMWESYYNSHQEISIRRDSVILESFLYYTVKV